jgi:hypothetical protein
MLSLPTPRFALPVHKIRLNSAGKVDNMTRFIRIAWTALATLIVVATATDVVPAAEVVLSRVPQNGIQPQALVGSDGTVHLVYFQGEPKAGDLFYIGSRRQAQRLQRPRRWPERVEPRHRHCATKRRLRNHLLSKEG